MCLDIEPRARQAQRSTGNQLEIIKVLHSTGNVRLKDFRLFVDSYQSNLTSRSALSCHLGWQEEFLYKPERPRETERDSWLVEESQAGCKLQAGIPAESAEDGHAPETLGPLISCFYVKCALMLWSCVNMSAVNYQNTLHWTVVAKSLSIGIVKYNMGISSPYHKRHNLLGFQ